MDSAIKSFLICLFIKLCKQSRIDTCDKNEIDCKQLNLLESIKENDYPNREIIFEQRKQHFEETCKKFASKLPPLDNYTGNCTHL